MKSVVFVGGFGHSLGTLLRHSFFIGDNWGRLDNWDLCVLVDQIVDTDFDVQFSGTAHDVLTGGFVIDTQDLWVGLGESLHSLDKFWEISGVLWLNSNSNNWGH